MQQMTLFEDNAEYDAFVDKFKPKLTTDDCYTPAPVYEAVAEWVAREYGLDRSRFVRPFWPGGDYRAANYAADAVVVDNPPFSIMSEIEEFYLNKGVRFFLFAPALTMFKSLRGLSYIPVGADVIYENGANVRTSFVTNLEPCLVRTAPTLYKAITEAVEATRDRASLPKYKYPPHVITAAMVQRWSQLGVRFSVMPEDAAFIRALDAQREAGKSIFGAGFLLGESAAAAAAAAAARLEAEKVKEWALSERERAIVDGLGKEART